VGSVIQRQQIKKGTRNLGLKHEDTPLGKQDEKGTTLLQFIIYIYKINERSKQCVLAVPAAL
jgi:hypothetical protein